MQGHITSHHLIVAGAYLAAGIIGSLALRALLTRVRRRTEGNLWRGGDSLVTFLRLVRGAFDRQNSLAWETQGDNLAPPGRIRLILRKNSGANEHDFVARRSLFAKRTSRFHINDAVWHLI